jgi:hypothetical protein
MRRQQARIATLVVGLWLAAHPLRAQGDPVVNTTTFESRSKLFALEVDPSQRNGQGGASYRLSRRGHDIWSGELPFTLLDARVSDDGVAVGYSNTGGSRWSGEDKDTDLHLVILDAQGKLRLDEVLPRRLQDAKQGGTTRKTRWPNWRGLVLGEDSDRGLLQDQHSRRP